MGHERVGRLPRTRRWRSVVAAIAGAVDHPEAVTRIADSTLSNVRDRLKHIEQDTGVRAALQYLIALAHSAVRHEAADIALPDLSSNPSTARIANGLCDWVDVHRGSPEYAELAKQAASDAIALWSSPQATQAELFPEQLDVRTRWREAATAAGFSRLAREFFARFTERYLRYFLDRESSAALESVPDSARFNAQLSEQLDLVARHAFETSKITQSFSAGWYSRYAKDSLPSDRQLKAFLRLSFQKIREELAREAAAV